MLHMLIGRDFDVKRDFFSETLFFGVTETVIRKKMNGHVGSELFGSEPGGLRNVFIRIVVSWNYRDPDDDRNIRSW